MRKIIPAENVDIGLMPGNAELKFIAIFQPGWVSFTNFFMSAARKTTEQLVLFRFWDSFLLRKKEQDIETGIKAGERNEYR